MFKLPSFLSSTFLALGVVVSLPAPAAEFELVGREMTRILQDKHYSRLPFDEELSARFLERYLYHLDGEKTYFLLSEVEEFRRRHERSLHDRISTKTFMPIAEELFEVYRRRVSGRVSYVRQLLEIDNFDFSEERSVMLDREDAEWPVDGPAIQKIWRESLEEMILSEEVYRERLQARAMVTGKPDPFRDGPTAKEKVALRFDRLLKTVEGTSREDIANYFLSAVTNAYDPHSEYFSANEIEHFKIDVSNELVGIGARLSMNDRGETEIYGIVNDGPADRHGELELGDRVIAISPGSDGVWVDIMFKPIGKVIEYILGQEDAPVTLRVNREVDGVDEVLEIAIPRGVVTLKDDLASAKIYEYVSVKVVEKEEAVETLGTEEVLEEMGEGEEAVEADEMMGPVVQTVLEFSKLAVITVPSFYFDFDDVGNRVSVDVERLLKRLKKEGVNGIVLDLRDNGGGSLSEVQRMTGLFVGRGPVVLVKSFNGKVSALNSLHRKPLYDGPLVVLTNRGSASATEILAGALQDYNRAVVVGAAATYGKGTVQTTMDIADKMPIFSDRARAGWLKYTFQKYYRVSGSSVQIKGVIPDLILPDISDAYEVGEGYEKYALPHDVIGAGTGFKPRKRENLFIAHLQDRSRQRMENGHYFKYLLSDIGRAKAEIAKNAISLNRETRLAQLEESEKRRKTRTAERLARFAEVEERDQKSFKIYRLKLDDIGSDKLPLLDLDDHSEDHVRQAVDELADLEESLKWPSGIDAVKRESLQVLRDLIDASSAGE